MTGLSHEKIKCFACLTTARQRDNGATASRMAEQAAEVVEMFLIGRGFFAGVARPLFLEFSEGHFPAPFNYSRADWSMIQNGMLERRSPNRREPLGGGGARLSACDSSESATRRWKKQDLDASLLLDWKRVKNSTGRQTGNKSRCPCPVAPVRLRRCAKRCRDFHTVPPQKDSCRG
jgi:hypothetical protein